MPILDKNITEHNFQSFKKCIIMQSNTMIRFIMANDVSYDVTIDYFLNWYYEPHYIYIKNKWVKWNSMKHKITNNTKPRFKRWRRFNSNHAVTVFLNNKTAYDVPWDTVLMSCEKQYEHFGGFTKESKKVVHDYHKSLLK